MSSKARNKQSTFAAWATGVGKIVDIGSHVGRRAGSKKPEECLADHWRAVGGYISISMKKHGPTQGEKER